MQLILKKRVKKLGEIGDVVNVSDGYGRSFLLPQGIAVQATQQEIKQLQNKKKMKKEVKEKNDVDNARLIQSIGSREYKHIAAANPAGVLFAAVDAATISRLTGIPVKSIDLKKPIKELGTFSVTVTIGDKKGKATIIISGK